MIAVSMKIIADSAALNRALMTINGLARLSAAAAVDIEEYREWGQSEPGYRNDQKTLRRAGDNTDRVFRYAGVQGAGAGDPVTLPVREPFDTLGRHIFAVDVRSFT